MTKKKSKIKCEVESCKHQNNDKKMCELDEIKVSSGNDCNNDEVIEKQETVCDSFDCDDDKCDNNSSIEEEEEEEE